MLVRAQSIILWNPFLFQPINSLENEQDSRLVSSNEESLGNDSIEVEANTINTTTVDTKKKEQAKRIVTSNSSSKIVGTSTTIHINHNEDKKNKASISPVAADHSNNSTKNTTNDDTSLFFQESASSVNSFATVSSLLDKPIPTYINPTMEESETSHTNSENGEDGLIYYKRREDFYPQFMNKNGEDNDTISCITNTQQARRQSIHTLLGKAATKIYPGEGMPIFKRSSTTGASSDSLYKLKPKTVFRKIKTIVVKNKNRLSITSS